MRFGESLRLLYFSDKTPVKCDDGQRNGRERRTGRHTRALKACTQTEGTIQDGSEELQGALRRAKDEVACSAQTSGYQPSGIEDCDQHLEKLQRTRLVLALT